MAKKGSLRINLEYWLARLTLGVFSALPLPLAMRSGEALARAGFWFPKLRLTGERNLELAFPDLSPAQRRHLLRGCFENLGRLLGVFSHFENESPEVWRRLIDFRGLEHIAAAREKGQGVILFTGHVGAWELTSFGLSAFDSPFSFLVRRIDNPKIEALVDRARVHFGNRTIDKRSAAREMVQILRSGGTLGLLVDLNALDREAIFVDFFGVPASTTFMLAKLALRTDSPVLPVFAPWDKSRQKFLLSVDQPLSFEPTGNEADDVQRLTQAFTSSVEEYVRRYPEQWLWIHRRWKTRPDGAPEIYDSPQAHQSRRLGTTR